MFCAAMRLPIFFAIIFMRDAIIMLRDTSADFDGF